MEALVQLLTKVLVLEVGFAPVGSMQRGRAGWETQWLGV